MRLKKNPVDIIFSSITAIASVSVLLLILGILYVLILESYPSIEKFGFLRFITSTDWNPVKGSFGAATNLFGTAITTVLSILIAVPVAIGIAIFVTEIAPNFLKGPIGAAIELLAAIPSIIYGMWGLFTLAPIMANYIEPALQKSIGSLPLVGVLFEGTPMGIDLLTASVILSIMIIPFTASISRDAFNLTPAVIKESAYALGATKREVVKDIVIPYSKVGVFGGVVLSLGRALGETMAVAFVLGNNHQITKSLFDAAATITVTLANEFTEADTDIYLSSLFYLALLLFVMSFIILALAKFFILKTEKGIKQ
ncbi:MAG: phosphate ABC transporter permease subunit PstC [Deltaproteobacteria bacterium CG12_big_fil_rev_8_21_14_0_65_43_10]|nr:MAG: phosphate ABC transporter permease subunit PstC [Deltaproteobacteria bacterium CG2_30_43_15]PIQ44627.1 MAG: phosphate ABC transporter permease subunit PstC [Deltaproteobacteria bacterium CG12_big_fil_rev_8_21_14_0_65_43_10]PIU84352.1 MAG: phosphate ABC transporter permease subunit PstC [Deltaproteobacteria bacterium CG06_land_8_20_14_3_00_44_19]PIX24943.1 MAG: phosphate ABC transporter permease subunit PstC [Deltaproteobacteria bacterium CG_4_8_14_3_um_filter_43_13]PIZ19854.1 MAG: phosp